MRFLEHIAFPLRLRARCPAEEIHSKVEEASKMLQLGDLLDRKPGQLSGGQRQRVAMGRVMVRDARLETALKRRARMAVTSSFAVARSSWKRCSPAGRSRSLRARRSPGSLGLTTRPAASMRRTSAVTVLGSLDICRVRAL